MQELVGLEPGRPHLLLDSWQPPASLKALNLRGISPDQLLQLMRGQQEELLCQCRQLQRELARTVEGTSLHDAAGRKALLSRVCDELRRLRGCFQALEAACRECLVQQGPAANAAAAFRGGSSGQLHSAMEALTHIAVAGGAALALPCSMEGLGAAFDHVTTAAEQQYCAFMQLVQAMGHDSLAFAVAKLHHLPLSRCMSALPKLLPSVLAHAEEEQQPKLLRMAVELQLLAGIWRCALAVPPLLPPHSRATPAVYSVRRAELLGLHALWSAYDLLNNNGPGSSGSGLALEYLRSYALIYQADAVAELMQIAKSRPDVPLKEQLPDIASLLSSAAGGAVRAAGREGLSSERCLALAWIALLLCPASPGLLRGAHVVLDAAERRDPPALDTTRLADGSMPVEIRVLHSPKARSVSLLVAHMQAAPGDSSCSSPCVSCYLISVGQPPSPAVKYADAAVAAANRQPGGVPVRLERHHVEPYAAAAPSTGSAEAEASVCALATLLPAARWQAFITGLQQDLRGIWTDAQRLHTEATAYLEAVLDALGSEASNPRLVLLQQANQVVTRGACFSGPTDSLRESVQRQLQHDIESYGAEGPRARCVRLACIQQLCSASKVLEGSAAVGAVRERLRAFEAQDAAFQAAAGLATRMHAALRGFEEFLRRAACAAMGSGGADSVADVYDSTAEVLGVLVELHEHVFRRAISLDAATGQVTAVQLLAPEVLTGWVQRLHEAAESVGMQAGTREGVLGLGRLFEGASMLPLLAISAAGPVGAAAPADASMEGSTAETSDPQALRRQHQASLVQKAIQDVQGVLSTARRLHPAPSTLISEAVILLSRLQQVDLNRCDPLHLDRLLRSVPRLQAQLAAHQAAMHADDPLLKQVRSILTCDSFMQRLGGPHLCVLTVAHEGCAESCLKLQRDCGRAHALVAIASVYAYIPCIFLSWFLSNICANSIITSYVSYKPQTCYSPSLPPHAAGPWPAVPGKQGVHH